MVLKEILPTRIFDAIDRVGLSTTKQIITLSIMDIRKYTNLSVNDILLLKNIVCNHVCPNIISSNTLKKEASDKHLSTGFSSLDDLLKGGLCKGTITEVFGESGCGKTQLALQIALHNWNTGSLYICTEDLFPIKRFEELKQSLPAFNDLVDYGQNIFVEHLTEPNELLSCIAVRLPKLLTNNKLSTVIIDSIAAPFRCETTNYIRRAEELREVAISLIEIAQKYNLAILCINQVTAAFDDTSNVLPSLGLAWSNMISTRLMIKKSMKVYDMKYVRELIVIFAPHLPNTGTQFIITSSGIDYINI